MYLVTRWLRLTIDEWTALPWWQQRVYLEGMTAEQEATNTAATGGPGEGGGGDDDGVRNDDGSVTVGLDPFGSLL